MRKDGVQRWLLADHLGGTTGLLDATGNLVSGSTTTYWPYGATRTASVQGAARTDLLYTGQREEKDDAAGLGLYNYKARFYSTTLGRFVSADPLAVNGLNRYAYVRNNPLRWVDPSGLEIKCLLFCPGSSETIIVETETGEVEPDLHGVPPSGYCGTLCQRLTGLHNAGLHSPEEVAYALAVAAAGSHVGGATPSDPIPVLLPTPLVPGAGPGSDGGDNCLLCDLVGGSKDRLEESVGAVVELAKRCDLGTFASAGILFGSGLGLELLGGVVIVAGVGETAGSPIADSPLVSLYAGLHTANVGAGIFLAGVVAQGAGVVAVSHAC